MTRHNNLSKIQDVSRRLGVPTHTLRFWEKELGDIIVPLRTPGGQRLYSDHLISIIEQIQDLRNKGVSLGDIKARFSELEDKHNKQEDVRELEVLADRVARIVKSEVYRFFEKAGAGFDPEKLKSWPGIEEK